MVFDIVNRTLLYVSQKEAGGGSKREERIQSDGFGYACPRVARSMAKIHGA